MVTSVPSGVGIFIIDTEQDASRFAEGMCAYLTGRVGERGTGEEYVRYYDATGVDPLRNVVDIADDKDIMCPCSVWPTPGWFSNGAGGIYQKGQEGEALDDYRRHVITERNNIIRQKQAILHELYAGKTIKGLTPDKLQAEIRQHENEIREVQHTNRIATYPAYLSVAIFFLQIPDEITTDIMKLRAFQFVDIQKQVEANAPNTINITGFRALRVHHIRKLTRIQ